MAVVIKGMGKRKKEQDDDNDCLSHNVKKARRVVWSHDLHAKFVEAVNTLGVTRKIVALMNVDGITTSHVASHLQKYRLHNKKAVHQADRVPSSSTLIQQPTQSQNIHPPSLLPNKITLHQSHTVPVQIYSPPSFNISGVSPSTLVQSQSIKNHPPPSTFPNSVSKHHQQPSKTIHHHHTSTFPTQSQNIINNSFNIHPSYHFPINQTSPLLFPNKMPLHQSHTEIYSPASLNMSRVSATRSQNINESSLIIHPPPSTFLIYHQTSTFPTLVKQSTTPPALAKTFDFHDIRATNCPFVGSSSSKSTSISDYDWYTKYMKTEPQFLPLPNNSLPVSDSDKTSQMSSQQTEPFVDVSDYNLEDDTNIDISDYNLCSENSPIDFSVEKTNCNTLEWGCLEEDLINVMKLPSLC
ncbi:hypothetical protein RYX36_022463 [Vicia faba]